MNPLYRLETDAMTPEALAELRVGVMVVALSGYLDAGGVQQQLTTHILDTCPSTVLASFAIDELYDYRARRPVMVFDRDRWISYDDPALCLHLVEDRDGQPFLLVTGPEPDYQWERFIDNLIGLVRQLGVNLVVQAHGIPVGTPHTRPVGLTAHGTNPGMLPEPDGFFDKAQVPGSAAALLEYRLGELGRDAIGYAVHVPHYLGQREFVDAALRGLDAVIGLTGLSLDRDSLASRSVENRQEIDAECAQQDGMPAMLRALEEQYDAAVAHRGASATGVDHGPVPSADEIGAQAEAFLRRATGQGDEGQGGFGFWQQ